ncbi:winged helix DNA-binding protein [Sphingorhabdus soli]|uniref:Winged helix DNA-binding protein n=2 Tax=Flavisphingopyxis soli TaxID=2601267 RepID=A0A5C6U9R0_9SPHN|nr:winged helix DNA-binding protein [Sphingorhabdus soli]
MYQRDFPRSDETGVIVIADAAFLPRLDQPLPDAIRIVRTIAIDGPPPAPAAMLESALVWIGITHAPSDAWTHALRTEIADRPATAFVVEAVGAAALDWAWDALGDSRCTILADPTALDRSLALQAASSGLAAAAFDSGGETHANELARLRDEVGRIAHALANLTDAAADRMAGDGAGPTGASADGSGLAGNGNGSVADPARGYGYQPALDSFSGQRRAGVTSLDIRKMIRMRRLRDKHFPSDLFGDPAWDMLLDLMVARIDRLPVSVSSLCIASAVPATTALRWIKTMTEAGLFERRSDPSDGRRVFIALSDETAQAMHAYFADMLAIGSLLPA